MLGLTDKMPPNTMLPLKIEIMNICIILFIKAPHTQGFVFFQWVMI